MKHFTYIHSKTGKVLYEVTGPNYWNNDYADESLLKHKKINMLTTPHIIREIKVIKDK